MKITFLGTAAAEGIPSPFCACATCSHARVEGGRNIRKRQCVMINDNLLIDLGPDLFSSCAQLGISLLEVEHLLITHSHLDHFCISNLVLRAKPFRLSTELPEMTMIAGPSVLGKWEKSGWKDKEVGIHRRPIIPRQVYQCPQYSIRSIEAAHHAQIGDAMNYIINDGQTTLLFASDTGIYAEHVWDEFIGISFDMIIMEATMGKDGSGAEHLGFSDFEVMMNRLRELDAVTDRTIIIATHFSHQGVSGHTETSRLLSEMGVLCAYDGLVLMVGEEM